MRGKAHTNGVESFWSMLKRGYVGTYHKMSPKHLQRYVNEFSGRHKVRMADTLEQMEHSMLRMSGKRLRYKDLKRANSGFRGAGNGAMSGPRHTESQRTAGWPAWRQLELPVATTRIAGCAP